VTLGREIDTCEIVLGAMEPNRRTALVALWAGRARRVQDRWQHDPSVPQLQRDSLRRTFGRLSRLAREHHCLWIDALTPDWTTDWTVYCGIKQELLTGQDSGLSLDQRRSYWKARLRSILSPRRHVVTAEAVKVVAEATAVLPEDDAELLAATRKFGVGARGHAVAPMVRRKPKPEGLTVVPDPVEPLPVNH
jgi:hypothetical protein